MSYNDNDFEEENFYNDNILLDEGFLNRPIEDTDRGTPPPEDEVIEQEFGVNFREGMEKEIDMLKLDPRKEQDKPLVEISKEMEYMGLARDYIIGFLMNLRNMQTENNFKALPFLNARYLSNAYVFVASGGKTNEESIKAYISDKNEWYKTLREGKLDKYPYLDQTDFYRYVLIVEKFVK